MVLGKRKSYCLKNNNFTNALFRKNGGVNMWLVYIKEWDREIVPGRNNLTIEFNGRRGQKLIQNTKLYGTQTKKYIYIKISSRKVEFSLKQSRSLCCLGTKGWGSFMLLQHNNGSKGSQSSLRYYWEGEILLVVKETKNILEM